MALLDDAAASAPPAVEDGLDREGDRVSGIRHGGRLWLVPETERADLAALEKILRDQQRPPVDALADALAAAERGADGDPERRAARAAAAEMLADRAYRAVTMPATVEVKAEDVRAFIDTRAGGLTLLWVKMRRVKGQESLTREAVESMYDGATDADVQRRIDATSRRLIAQGKALANGGGG